MTINNLINYYIFLSAIDTNHYLNSWCYSISFQINVFYKLCIKDLIQFLVSSWKQVRPFKQKKMDLLADSRFYFYIYYLNVAKSYQYKLLLLLFCIISFFLNQW